MTAHNEMEARNEDIYNRRLRGQAFASIAREYGICRERVRQITFLVARRKGSRGDQEARKFLQEWSERQTFIKSPRAAQ